MRRQWLRLEYTPAVRRRRLIELLLLVLAVAVPLAGHLVTGYAVTGAPPDGFARLAGSLAAMALIAHLCVWFLAPRADPLLLPLAIFLSYFGLMLITRLDAAYATAYRSPPAAGGQLMWCAIGVLAFGLVLLLLRDHRRLQRYVYVTALAALVLLMAPAFFPGDTYGAKRWIRIGAASFQPGEIVKTMIVVFFAGYLTVHRESLSLVGRRMLGLQFPRARDLGPLVAVWAVSLLVLVLERDLGTSLIFFGVFVVLLYLTTERISWVLCSVLLASVGAFVVGSTEPHVKGRVVAWLHPMDIYLPPEQRPAGIVSAQPAQALFSFGSGRLTGTGLGSGHPELIGFAGRSDFILTTVGEELGLAGVLALLLVYVLLFTRVLRVATLLPDHFGKLLATGIATTVALQVFVVTGGVTGLIPLTGKALPFLAMGGSSLLANWLAVGLMLRLSHAANDAIERT